MAAINAMYQYSLSSYLEVFNYSLKKSLPDSHLPKRLKNIMDTLTHNVYNYACTGKSTHMYLSTVALKESCKTCQNLLLLDMPESITVEPWLSESPLSEPSVIQMYRNPKRWFKFLQNHVINGMLMWFLYLLGLLYHSTVDRKDILEMQYYRPPTHLINR